MADTKKKKLNYRGYSDFTWIVMQEKNENLLTNSGQRLAPLQDGQMDIVVLLDKPNK